MLDVFDIEENQEFRKTYEDLLHIPFSAYITTNYNTTLSEVARRLAENDPGFYRPRDMAYPNLTPRSLNDRSIAYLHGNIHGIEDVILTRSSYHGAYFTNSTLPHVLGKIFQEHTLVFIGTRFGDHDIRHVLGQVDRIFQSADPRVMPRRYAMISYNETEEIPKTHALQTVYRISPLYFRVKSKHVKGTDNPEIMEEVEDYSELYESIKLLRESTRRYPAPPTF